MKAKYMFVKSSNSSLLLRGLTVIAVMSTAHAAVVANFNGVSNPIPGSFNANGQTLPTWSATNGIGATGGIDLPSSPRNFGNYQAVANSGAESFSTVGSTLVTSMFLRIDAAPTSSPADARLLDLYAATSSATNFTISDAANAHVGVRLNTIGDNLTYRMQSRNNGDSSNIMGTTTFSLTLGNWYLMSVLFTNVDVAAGTISLDVNLDDYGTAGTTFASNVFTGTANVTNTTLTGDSTVFGGFRIPRGDNLSGADNFSFAVPEPGSALLAGMGLALLAVRRKRA